MNDLISRQAAIDSVMELVNFDTIEELQNHCNEYLIATWSDGILGAIYAINALPSAQPEQFNPCTVCQEFDCTGCKFRRTE